MFILIIKIKENIACSAKRYKGIHLKLNLFFCLGKKLNIPAWCLSSDVMLLLSSWYLPYLLYAYRLALPHLQIKFVKNWNKYWLLIWQLFCTQPYWNTSTECHLLEIRIQVSGDVVRGVCVCGWVRWGGQKLLPFMVQGIKFKTLLLLLKLTWTQSINTSHMYYHEWWKCTFLSLMAHAKQLCISCPRTIDNW